MESRVEVTAGATLIETDTARIGDSKNAVALKSLPLNTRNLYEFLALTPGVLGAGGGQATRVAQWKAIQQPMNSPVRLYDLSKDIGEEHDVAAAHADVVAKLTMTMKAAYTPHENWNFPTAGPAKKK